MRNAKRRPTFQVLGQRRVLKDDTLHLVRFGACCYITLLVVMLTTKSTVGTRNLDHSGGATHANPTDLSNERKRQERLHVRQRQGQLHQAWDSSWERVRRSGRLFSLGSQRHRFSTFQPCQFRYAEQRQHVSLQG